MLVTKETQDKIDKLPLTLRVVADTLINCLNNLISGDCDTNEIIQSIADVNDHSQGRYSNDDLMNYDDTCKTLGYSVTNRVGMKREMDKNGIKQVVMNGHNVGFPRHKVEALARKR